MVKVLNIFGDVYSGQSGKAGVFAKWKGRQYRRKYVVPANPKTTMQQQVRGFFTNAVGAWHTYSSLQRLVFSYLATGLVMSGFNLLVSRWQKAATTGATLPIDPVEGIKQVGSAMDDTETLKPVTGSTPVLITAAPVQIGSLTYTPAGTDAEMDCYIDLDMGDVRIPVTLTKVDGRKGLGLNIEEDDQLVISYKSGGRTITREVLYTVPSEGVTIPAVVAIADALRTAYYPIDIESVAIEIRDDNAVGEKYTELEGLEIKNLDSYVSGGEIIPRAYVFFTLTPPADPDSEIAFTSYTAINGAKLEVTKVDTSFITWRRYSTVLGAVMIAQSVEDEAYDWRLSAPGFVSEIRAAQSAILSTQHELIVMASVA